MAHAICFEDLRTALAGNTPPLLLDVRRALVMAEATDRLPGARWRDPAEVADWAASLPADRPVVVYCVHGHQVSQGCADALAAQGRRASYLEGGIEGWRAAGGPLLPTPAGD